MEGAGVELDSSQRGRGAAATEGKGRCHFVVFPREGARFSNRNTRRCLCANSEEEVEVSLHLVGSMHAFCTTRMFASRGIIVLVGSLKATVSTSMYGGGLHKSRSRCTLPNSAQFPSWSSNDHK